MQGIITELIKSGNTFEWAACKLNRGGGGGRRVIGIVWNFYIVY